MGAELETWQVWSEGTVYEADFDTLRQWITEGCVLPTDKVRKGNLRWIEAGRAPLLRAIFNGEDTAPSQSAQPQTPSQTVQASHAPSKTEHAQTTHQAFHSQQAQQSNVPADSFAEAASFGADIQAEPKFVEFDSTPPPPPIELAVIAGAAACYNHPACPP